MNKKRRQEIRTVYAALENVQHNLQEIINEEEKARDSIPENLSDSRRAEESDEAIDSMDDADDCIREALEHLDNVV